MFHPVWAQWVYLYSSSYLFCWQISIKYFIKK